MRQMSTVWFERICNGENVIAFFVEGGLVSNPLQKDGKDAYEHGKEAEDPQERDREG